MFLLSFPASFVGGAFFSHVLLALTMFDMTPWSCNMLSRSQKMCPHFCMARRFCGLRHSRWGGAFPSLVLIGTHGMDQFYHVAFTLASASRKHQRLVVNCRCCSWCAATMQLIGLFLQIQSSWTWAQCMCICVYVFLSQVKPEAFGLSLLTKWNKTTIIIITRSMMKLHQLYSGRMKSCKTQHNRNEIIFCICASCFHLFRTRSIYGKKHVFW